MGRLVAFVFAFVAAIANAENGCIVQLDALTGKDPPLLLQNSQFLYPTSRNSEDKRILEIAGGEKLELYCHGSVRYQDQTVLSTTGLPAETSANVTCKDGSFFSQDNKQVSVEAATCNRRLEPRLVKTQEQCSPIGADGRTSGLEDLYTIQIGFMIRGSFIEQVRVCHDEKVYGTVWVSHVVLGNSIDFGDNDGSRPSFRIDNTYLKRFYTWTTSTNMNAYYSKKTQYSTMLKLLGHNTFNGQPIIDTTSSGTNYFAKGHLAPDAAFIYTINQDATYYFFNVAPQFQSFNNGNWKALEMNTRDLAQSLGKDLSVYTGTHQVLQYEDKYGEMIDIFLYIDGTTRYVPAPKYYWKVVYDEETKAGVAFIGLNDPHAMQAPEELCDNVCDSIPWVDWSITELDAGYMYCCSVESAHQAIPSIPNIKTSGLLTKTPNTIYEYIQPDGPCRCTCQEGAGKCGGCSCTCTSAGK